MQSRTITENIAVLALEAKTDSAAFGRFYDLYVQPVYRYLYSRVGSVHEAEDLTSQTFIAAYEALPKYHERGFLAAWLLRIARSKMNDQFRYMILVTAGQILRVAGLPAGEIPATHFRFCYFADRTMRAAILNSQQENQWIAMARKGDLYAFNQLVLAYQDVLFRIALWMLNDEEGAADAVQAALLTAYHEINKFRDGAFLGWLLKMVRKACKDEFRRYKRQTWTPLAPQGFDGDEAELAPWLREPGLSPEETLLQHEAWERIEQYLWQLPEPMREVVVMIDIEDMDFEEASIVLGIPLRTVKSRLARARVCLRKIIQRE